jgi:hypothetical protein
MVNIVILLIIVALAAIISAQNAAPVAFTLLFWKIETTLSVVSFLINACWDSHDGGCCIVRIPETVFKNKGSKP